MVAGGGGEAGPSADRNKVKNMFFHHSICVTREDLVWFLWNARNLLKGGRVLSTKHKRSVEH